MNSEKFVLTNGGGIISKSGMRLEVLMKNKISEKFVAGI
jgi:hypothetical protein